ncbi:MAG: MetQ/NlpA family ABC transporter substrate-binding protein [Sutterellaceae bacterium]|nr:MetQ/NlpA family ABC transporter substrate-binding protein [Sutterellaceae bacterium]MDD7443028.1 MetQ/NlpA family ABC transporter substrate-binding protein [Sutterellaceae bacterium]MDY2867670.1 MetQ/NlpA family ABC transporter substrate-binding protein [Mesosutterella sp.]
MLNRRTLLTAAAAAAIASASLVSVPASAAGQVIRVGVNPGSQAEIMEVVKKNAAKLGLEIKIVEFSDYIAPNVALDSGDIDANSFQHQPYLDRMVKDRHYKIESVAKTIVAPLVFFTNKGYKSIKDLPAGSKIAIPNDATNEGRALLILEHEGLIKLNPKAGLQATPIDIKSNPKKFKFVELEAPQLPRSLPDVACAAVNSTFAIPAGLSIKKQGILVEDAKSSAYANVIVVRTADKNKPWVSTLIKAYHSPNVKSFIQKRFGDTTIPAW